MYFRNTWLEYSWVSPKYSIWGPANIFRIQDPWVPSEHEAQETILTLNINIYGRDQPSAYPSIHFYYVGSIILLGMRIGESVLWITVWNARHIAIISILFSVYTWCEIIFYSFCPSFVLGLDLHFFSFFIFLNTLSLDSRCSRPLDYVFFTNRMGLFSLWICCNWSSKILCQLSFNVNLVMNSLRKMWFVHELLSSLRPL